VSNGCVFNVVKKSAMRLLDTTDRRQSQNRLRAAGD